MNFCKFNIFFILLSFQLNIWGFSDTPKYWKCHNRNGGEWRFGRAPQICDMDFFLDPDIIKKLRVNIVFDDKKDRITESRRYMQTLYTVIRDTSIYYINSRNPNATSAEKEIWINAVFAIAHQESYWSHYRKNSKGKIQMMRGDYGHGHGIFQADDRWHIGAIEDGRAAHIIFNMIYSLDEYYSGWKNAEKKCSLKSRDFKSIARSAYSAYNGGPSKICRWKNPYDKWARNDKGFLSKFNQKKWLESIDDEKLDGNLDIKCVVHGGLDCFISDDEDSNTDVFNYTEGAFYKFKNNLYCIYQQEKLHCAQREEDKYCLSKNLTFFEIQQDSPSETTPINRHLICPMEQNGLIPVGAIVKVQKNINLRKSPAGIKVGLLKEDKLFQVLDFYFKENGKRYYQVKSDTAIGYFYAGDSDSHNNWAIATNERPKNILIPLNGDFVKIDEKELKVDKLRIQRDSNHIWLTNDQSQDFYFGMTLPTLQLKKFIHVDQNIKITYGKSKNIKWYLRLKQCATLSCKKKEVSIYGPRWGHETFIIERYSGNYALIKKQNGQGGWAHRYYIQEVEK
jgi:hypothetical protein